MKVKVDEVSEDRPFMVIYVEHNGCSSCDHIGTMMENESFEIEGEPDYLQVWNQVCEDIFGSWLVRCKEVCIGSWAIFYPVSKIGLIAKVQRSHFRFTAVMATLEMERIEKLIIDKYGLQLKMDLE